MSIVLILIDTSSYNSPLCLLQNCEHLSNKVKSTFSSTNSFLINDGKNTSARGLSLLEHCLDKADFEPLFLYTFSHAP